MDTHTPNNAAANQRGGLFKVNITHLGLTACGHVHLKCVLAELCLPSTVSCVLINVAMGGSCHARASVSVFESAAFVFVVIKSCTQLIRESIDGMSFCKAGPHLFS